MPYLDYVDEATLILGALATLLLALGAFAVNVASLSKVRAEVAKMNYEMRPSDNDAEETATLRELGEANRDRLVELAASVGGIRDDMRDDRREHLRRQTANDETHLEHLRRINRLEARRRPASGDTQ